MYRYRARRDQAEWDTDERSAHTSDQRVEPDYYAILGLTPDATSEDIQRAFRRLTKLWHPDRYAHATADDRARAERRMRQLIAARDVLADPAQREAYDERRRAAIMGNRYATAFPTAWSTPAYFGAGYTGTLEHASANPNGAGQFAAILAIVLAIALFGGAVSGGLGSSMGAVVVFGGIALLLGLAAAFLTSGSPLARGAQAWMEGEPSPRRTSESAASVVHRKRSGGDANQPPAEETHDAFAALASSALASVPDEFQRWLRNVLVEIVDEPSEEMLHELEVREGCTLFGLYSGVPLTRQGGLDVPTEIISIFQGPIERHCGSDAECMREQVRRTVLHELAHHFGMRHEEMPAWIR